MDMTPDRLRVRFAELSAARDAKHEASAPLRDKRDALVQSSAAQVATLDEQIAAAEDGMEAIAQELAMISRALGGRTGTPDDA